MTSISLAFLLCHITVVAFRNPRCGNYFASCALFTGSLCVLLGDSSLPLAVWSENWGWKSELSFGQALVWGAFHPFSVEGLVQEGTSRDPCYVHSYKYHVSYSVVKLGALAKNKRNPCTEGTLEINIL